jgi:hypothetical protein
MEKFEIRDNRSFKEKLIYFLKGLIFWKGRPAKIGFVHTRNLEWRDFQYIFFPKGFQEKYGYLGTCVRESSYYFKYLYPLVLALDYEARPNWCPRWFLRFLHVFGDDKSIVRVRHRSLHNLKNRLTKGIGFIDWKTKWHQYDLRISISAPEHLHILSEAIEAKVYEIGHRKLLEEAIKEVDPTINTDFKSISQLKQILEEITEK